MILKHFLHVFLLFLVFSITPVSAELINNANSTNVVNGTSDTVLSDENTAMSYIESDIVDLSVCLDSLTGDLDYVKHRAGDYSWKFWKWPKITRDIIATLDKISLTAKKLEAPADKLKLDTNKLKNLTETKQLNNNISASDSLDCVGDAQSMANELTKCLGTSVTVKQVQASDVEKGDIIQYMSQGKYPRYLTIIDIQEQTVTDNITGKRSTNIPVLVLKGTGDRIFTAEKGAYLELNYGCVDFLKVSGNTTQIQQKDINKVKKEVESPKKHSDRLDTAALSFTIIGTSITTIGIALAGLGAGLVCTIALSSIGGILLLVGGLMPTTGLGIVTIGVLLYQVSDIIKKTYMPLLNEANQKQKDLNTYTETGKHEKIDINTFEGIPIVKHPPVENWKNIPMTIMNHPEHGDLLTGPGLQFLYGPKEGYTGNDTFTVQYNRNGKLICMTININIQPIPVLNVPQPGGV